MRPLWSGAFIFLCPFTRASRITSIGAKFWLVSSLIQTSSNELQDGTKQIWPNYDTENFSSNHSLQEIGKPLNLILLCTKMYGKTSLNTEQIECKNVQIIFRCWILCFSYIDGLQMLLPIGFFSVHARLFNMNWLWNECAIDISNFSLEAPTQSNYPKVKRYFQL